MTTAQATAQNRTAPNRGKFVRYENRTDDRTQPHSIGELGSNATAQEPHTTAQAFLGSGHAEVVGTPPFRGGWPTSGLRLTGTKIPKVGVMLHVLERIQAKGIETEALRVQLVAAAQQEPYDAESIHAEVQRVAAECRGEKLLGGLDLAMVAESVFEVRQG